MHQGAGGVIKISKNAGGGVFLAQYLMIIKLI